jgi:hypothetical protein
MIAGYFAWQEWNRTDAERAIRFESNFQTTSDSKVRLENLAGLFELGSETNDYDNQARKLFTSLDQKDKVDLFSPSTTRRVEKNQLTAALGIYQNMAITNDDNALLIVIGDRMETIHPDLSIEINAWLEGRDALIQADYVYAEKRFTSALKKNSKNPGLYYDRAQAYVGMGQNYYPKVIGDLTMMVQLDEKRAVDSYRLIKANSSLASYWAQNVSNYSELAQVLQSRSIQVRAFVWKAVTQASDSQLIYIIVQDQVLRAAADAKCTAFVHWPKNRTDSSTISTNSSGIGTMALSFSNQPLGALIYVDITCSYEEINGATTTSFRIWY